MNDATKTFVIVSEDETLITAVRSAVGERAVLQVLGDVATARAHMELAPPTGLVVDALNIPGNPVTQLARLRAVNPLMSILFVASELRGGLLNDIQPLRVELLARPVPAGGLARFVERTLSVGRLSDLQVGVWIERLTSMHKLSGQDVALFPLVLDRETPEALCARLNIDEATLSRGLRRLVKKCRVRNTDRLAKNLMRDALLCVPAHAGGPYLAVASA